MANPPSPSTSLEYNQSSLANTDGSASLDMGGYAGASRAGLTPDTGYEYHDDVVHDDIANTNVPIEPRLNAASSSVVGGALRGMRVRTGCNTCRKRHVKCDEQKPICANCSKGSRICVFPTADSLFRHNRTNSISKKSSTSCTAQAGSRKSIDFSVGFPPGNIRRLSVTDSPPSSLSSLNKCDVDLSGILSLATVAAGHELLPTVSADHRTMAPPQLSPNPASSRYGQPQLPSNMPRNADRRDVSMTSGVNESLGQFHLPNLYYPGQSHPTYKPSQQWPMGATEDLLSPNDLSPSAAERSPMSRAMSVNDLVSDSANMNAELIRRASTSSRSDYEGPNFGSYDIVQATQPGLEGISEHDANTVNDYVAAISLHGHNQRHMAAGPLPLTDHEAIIFQNFVHTVAPWIDIFDVECHFALSVPRLARNSPALLKACLSLSAKQMYGRGLQNINTVGYNNTNTQIEFGQYYDAALREMQQALRNDVDGSLENSDELLATAVILSTFEVLDASNHEFKQGAKSIIRPQHGLGGGLKQAAFWCWYRQDIWDAFRQRRLTHITEDFWRADNLYLLRDDELSNRIIYLSAQVINYCATGEADKNESHLANRSADADSLERKLNEWKHALPISFQPLTETRAEGGLFRKLWFNPGYCGVALQVYHFALILLAMHRPRLDDQDGLQQYLSKRQLYRYSSEYIIGISLARCEGTRHLVSIQCLYAAGLVLEGKEERKVLIDLIKECQDLTGRSTYYLITELEDIWRNR